MDRSTVFGLLLGVGGILLGNFLEGGHIASLGQGTAFIIVITGTFGAVLISNRTSDLKLGFKLFKQTFKQSHLDYKKPIDEILDCARLAKKETALALEPKLNQLQTPMLKEILKNVIDVMGNLTDTSKLGTGIAVAFVATVYGVGFANLIYIPISNKIKKNVFELTRYKKMILEGALLVGTGLNPQLIEQKLTSYMNESTQDRTNR